MIIGIAGKMGSGKTTVAKKLREILPDFEIKSFGNKIKQECSENFNYPLDWNYTIEGKNKNVKFFNPQTKLECEWKVRKILQWYGTDYIRKNHGNNYWVDKLFNDLSLIDNIIIDDVREIAEIEAIKERKGLLIKLEVFNEWLPNKFSKHSSETNLDDYHDYDLILTPNEGVDQLELCSEQIAQLYDLKKYNYLEDCDLCQVKQQHY